MRLRHQVSLSILAHPRNPQTRTPTTKTPGTPSSTQPRCRKNDPHTAAPSLRVWQMVCVLMFRRSGRCHGTPAPQPYSG